MLPVLLALLLLCSDRPRLLAAGLAAGAAAGLKLTVLVPGVALAAGLLAADPVPLAVLPRFALGSVLGFLATGGFWCERLLERFANPVFPFLNGLFRSPFFSAGAVFEPRFVARHWWEPLSLPLEMAMGWTSGLQEIRFREPRFLLVFLALLGRPRRRARTRSQPRAPVPDSRPTRPPAPDFLARSLGPVGLQPALLPLRGRARAPGPGRPVRVAARHAVGPDARDRRGRDRDRAREPARVLGPAALVRRLVRRGLAPPRPPGREPGDRGRRARGLPGALLPRGHAVRGPHPTRLARAGRPDRASAGSPSRPGLPSRRSRRHSRRCDSLRPRARARVPTDRHPRRRPLPLSPATHRFSRWAVPPPPEGRATGPERGRPHTPRRGAAG